MFFKLVRFVLSPVLLIGNAIFPPRRLPKEELKVHEVAAAQQQLTLYQFKACPFCIKVRRQGKRLGLKLETRNVLDNNQWHDELEQQGGKRKVPCLRIESEHGVIEWLYESKAINAYLLQRLAV